MKTQSILTILRLKNITNKKKNYVISTYSLKKQMRQYMTTFMKKQVK